ncbi:unnamed protein product, partial [Ilex paraguariensis]
GQPQTLLYKNLWLEFEAELCSIGYTARFERMKIEMDKSKLDNSNSINMAGKQLPEVVHAGFAGKGNCWPFSQYQQEDGCLDVGVGPPHLQHDTGNGCGDKFGSYRDGSDHDNVREFRVSAKDDSVFQSYNSGLATQRSSWLGLGFEPQN